MYYQDYMRKYYLSHKEKIKKQSMEWREKNMDRVKAIQSRYRKKHGSICGDLREERIEVLPFEKRVSKETLARLKYNSQVNKGRVKYYEWPEDWIPKKRILEGV